MKGIDNMSENKFYGNKTFEFTGKLKSVDNIFKTTEGKNYIRLNLPLFDGESTVYCDSFTYGESDHIYMTLNSKWTQVAWSERNSTATLNAMRYGDKFSYNEKQLSNSYDLIQSLKSDIESGKIKKDDVLKVEGNVELEFYKDTLKKKYTIKSIKPVGENSELGFYVKQEVLVEPNGLKEVEDGFTLDVLMLEYMKLEGEDKRNPRLVGETLAYPTTNPQVKMLIKRALSDIETYKAIHLKCKLERTAPEVEVKPLTDDQKLYIDLGFITEEEAVRENTVVSGEVIEKLTILRPDVKKQYAKITFVPEVNSEWIKGLEPKVESALGDSFFDGDALDGSDLDSFFGADLPF